MSPLAIFATLSALVLTPVPNPVDTGDNVISFDVPNDGTKPVSLVVSMPAMGTMPYMEQRSTVKEHGKNHYEASFHLPMAGTWEIALTLDKNGEKRVEHATITTGIPGVTIAPTDTSNAAALPIGQARLQKIGVRFAVVKSVPLLRSIEAVGVVEQDQTHREEVTMRFSGYVAKQLRGRVGDSVRAGEALFTVYSPDLVTAQSEFLLADKLPSGGHSLHAAAADRLRNLGLSDHDIADIRKDGKAKRDVAVRAKASGTILEVNVREGAAVSAGQVVYVIGDLSRTFLVARVFQQDIADLRVGQPAVIRLPGSESRPVKGKIDLIYPQVEPGVGTANVRVEVTEPEARLRPGMYVDIAFEADLGTKLAVPAEALLYSGRHRYVFVDRGNGALEPRAVETGRSAGNMVEVTSGLAENDRVAASGTFLLGSEAQLRSALPTWTTAP